MCVCLKIEISSTQINRQYPNIGDDIEADTIDNESDTIVKKAGFLSLFKGEPGKAALYSLLIPAGGQIYNKKWWKVPLALGVDGGLTYVLIANRKSYKDAQAQYQKALSDPKSANVSILKQQRDYYRKWSEYAWVWLIGGHILTVADAFVDRHLMNFDISDDLTYDTNRYYKYESTASFHVGCKINLNTKDKFPQPKLLILIP
jgi:hypothetical protein